MPIIKKAIAMMMNNKIFSKNELNNNNNNNMRSPFDLEDLENDDNHLNHDGSGGPEGDLVDGFNHQRNQHIRGNIDEYGRVHREIVLLRRRRLAIRGAPSPSVSPRCAGKVT